MIQKLVENFIVKPENYSKVVDALKESNSVSVQGNTFKALAVFRFSFTRPDKKNLNGRIYPYALWDKVITLSPTTLALADHPEEGPGKPHDIWAVVRNPMYSDDRSVLTADAYILDNELGRSAVAVLEAGGELGLSSSGYGDFLSDGITVDPETFSLERYFDWVLQPSYEIFGNLEDKILESENKEGEAQMAENTKKEMSLREKREFELSMTKIYEGTASIEDLEERLEKAKEALTFYEDVDSDAKKPDFEVLIAETEAAIEEKKSKKEDDDEDEKGSEDKKDSDDGDSKEDDDKEEKSKKDEALIEALQKELVEQKAAYDELVKKKKESDSLLESFAKDTASKIEYSKYEELRKYTEDAVKLLSEKRSEINSLKAENLSLEEKLTLSEKRVTTIMNKALSEQDKAVKDWDNKVAKKQQEQLNAIKEAEKALLENASEEVLQYYEDLVARGEKVEHMREEILTKKTLFEAQTYFFRNKNRVINDPVSLIESDLSQPLNFGRGTPVTSSIEKRKGWL